MPRYRVTVEEVWLISFEVEATNEEEARETVSNDWFNTEDLDTDTMTFSHLTDYSEWAVEELE